MTASESELLTRYAFLFKGSEQHWTHALQRLLGHRHSDFVLRYGAACACSGLTWSES